MPELKAPPEELVKHLHTNIDWMVVAEKYDYRSGREARNAALQARAELDESDGASA